MLSAALNMFVFLLINMIKLIWKGLQKSWFLGKGNALLQKWDIEIFLWTKIIKNTICNLHWFWKILEKSGNYDSNPEIW